MIAPENCWIKTERDESGGVRLSVKDSGVGIDSEMKKKLFEAFYTTKVDGMGIGLSVSRSILERSSGPSLGTPERGPGRNVFVFHSVQYQYLSLIDVLSSAAAFLANYEVQVGRYEYYSDSAGGSCRR